MNQPPEIERDRAAGTPAPGQPAISLSDPERRATTEDSAATPSVSTLSAKWRALAIAFALVVLLAGVGIYLKLAHPDLLGTKPFSVAAPAKVPVREMDLDKLATRLAARL